MPPGPPDGVLVGVGVCVAVLVGVAVLTGEPVAVGVLVVVGVPVAVGVGFKAWKHPQLHPYVGADASLIFFYVDPNTRRPHVAPGAKVKGGLKIMATKRFGVFDMKRDVSAHGI